MTVEFVDMPERGRVYRTSRAVRLGDVDGRSEMHLEALGRFLQDAAVDDVFDAGLSDRDGVWVVRRYDFELGAAPALRDVLDIVTFCSGTGPCSAERRTSVTMGSTPIAEAAALWVFANRAGRPIALPDEFIAVYGEAAGGRRVRSRLEHPKPGPQALRRQWQLRARDLDLLDHVNNARALEAVQDEVALRRPDDRIARVSVEFRGALARETDVDLRSEIREVEGGVELTMWLVTEGDIRMSAVVSTTGRAAS